MGLRPAAPLQIGHVDLVPAHRPCEPCIRLGWASRATFRDCRRGGSEWRCNLRLRRQRCCSLSCARHCSLSTWRRTRRCSLSLVRASLRRHHGGRAGLRRRDGSLTHPWVRALGVCFPTCTCELGGDVNCCAIKNYCVCDNYNRMSQENLSRCGKQQVCGQRNSQLFASGGFVGGHAALAPAFLAAAAAAAAATHCPKPRFRHDERMGGRMRARDSTHLRNTWRMHQQRHAPVI